MRILLFCYLMFLPAAFASACTVCGCSASNQYLGILPQFHKHFVGLQYQHRSFQSEHPGHGEQGSTYSNEQYSTVQVWGRYNLSNRVQLFGFMPYSSNIKKESGSNTRISGLGDITLLANYRLLINEDPTSKWQQNLQAGGGIKLQTGAYDKNATFNENGLPNMQPGTNSWDFILNANYTLRRNNIGINADASYTITTPNTVNYKFGNRISTGLLAFYWLEKNNLTLLPQAGLRIDLAGSDYDHYRNGWKNDMSGGSQLYATLGIQTFYKRLGAQIMYHHPVYQHYASGLVNTKFKSEAGIFLLF